MEDEAEKPGPRHPGPPDPAKGGRARASVLTAEERREIAKKAIRARWDKRFKEVNSAAPASIPTGPEPGVGKAPAERAGPELPYSMFRGTLQIGDVAMECHVLSNSQRVLTQREVVRVLSGGRESGNLQRYLDRNPLTAENFDLGPTVNFTVPETQVVGIGHEAIQLVEICDRYLRARELKLLKPSQLKLAKQAEIVIRASAKVGIIALIDEATGYDKVKARRDYQVKLQAFIAEDMQEWARMFPESFWLELARLEGVRYSPRSRPLRWGKYVMMFVYDAIDPDIGNWLRANNPSPRFKKNHHQWLKEFGREQVHDQITKVVTIMNLCKDMEEFREKFSYIFDKAPLQLTFDDIDWGAAMD